MLEELTGGSNGGLMGYIIGAGGAAAVIGKALWDKFINTEGRSHEALVQQLTDRVAAQETKLQKLEDALDIERRLRRLEQGRVHSLVIYIIELKAELRRHGIEVPTSKNLLTEDEQLAEMLGIDGDLRDGTTEEASDENVG